MRIAIDARELSGRPTGVGRYLAELLRGWDALPGAAAHEFVLCAPAPIDLPFIRSLRLSQATAPGRGPWWEQRVLPSLAARQRADVLFAPAYSGPIFASMPVVVTVHDVSFAAHPEWFAPREGLRRRWLTRWSARRARRVLTVSDFSKREIVRWLGVDPARIDVVYSGSTPFLSAPAATASGPAAQPRPLVLYVGSVFARRHVPELMAGFAQLAARHPDARLAIVGDNRSRPPIDLEAVASDTGQRARIELHRYAGDDELARLYGAAGAFAFLSEYEGFGLTPLDALAAGVPIVVLDTEIAREIYGPAAVYIARPDPRLVADALERVLFDAGERARLREAAATILGRYSWAECAQRTLQILLAAGG